MKTTKKILILLIAILAIGLLFCSKVEASTGGKTAEDAINWCRSQEGQWVRTGQCVTFVSAYYEYLGQQTPSYYYAKELIDHVNDQPAGWQVIRDSNVQPQMGDILVYTGEYGHVAIYEADNALWHANWGEGSGESGTVVRWYGNGYKNLSGVTFVGVVRPDFNSTSAPKITYLSIANDMPLVDSFDVRVTVTSSAPIKAVPVKVWISGVNTPITQNAVYDSSLNCCRSLFLGKDIPGWKDGYANVCCVTATATDANNKTSEEVHLYDTPLAGRVTDLGEFTARIVPAANSNYAIKLMGGTNGSAIKLATKSTTAKDQLWKFTKRTGDWYEITNVSYNKVITVQGIGDSDGTPLVGWDDNDAAHATFLIQRYQDGYRLIACNSREMRAIDVNEGKFVDGAIIQEYVNGNTQYNKAQTFKFEKIANSIKISPTSVSLSVGDTKQLSAIFTPTDTYNKSVTWKSSNTSIATVSTSGLVTAKAVGKTTITATTKDGSNKSASITINVTEKHPDGLNEVNGTWYYYKNNKVDTSYTGLVEYKGNWFYVQKGILKWGEKTLVEYKDNWFYVNNSIVDWNYTGLVEYKGNWFYIQKGILKWGERTLVEYKDNWFYVNNSIVDWNYTGLVEYKGTWFYIQKGLLKWGEKTLVEYKGNWFYVNNSKVDWGYTGLVEYKGNWFYIQKGTIKWGQRTLVLHNGTWFYVNNSVVDWNYTGLVAYNNNLFYIQKGVLRWGYNGTTTYNGAKYEIKNSIAYKK